MGRGAGALTSAGAGGAAAAGVGPDATGALLVTCAAEERNEDGKVLFHFYQQCRTQTSGSLQFTAACRPHLPPHSPAQMCKAHACILKHLCSSADLPPGRQRCSDQAAGDLRRRRRGLGYGGWWWAAHDCGVHGRRGPQ